MRTIKPLATWLYMRAALFVGIIFILACGAFIKEQLKTYDSFESMIAVLDQIYSELSKYAEREIDDSIGRVNDLSQSTRELVNFQITQIDEKIRNIEDGKKCKGPLDVLAACFIDDAKADVKISILKQERDYLSKVSKFHLDTNKVLSANTELERLIKTHAGIYALLKNNEMQQEDIKQTYPRRHRLPGTDAYKALTKLEVKHHVFLTSNQKAYKEFEAQRRLVQMLPAPEKIPPFSISHEDINKIKSYVSKKIADINKIQSGNWVTKLTHYVSDVLPASSIILLLAIFTPYLVKLIFYFLIAPIASRSAPFSILPTASGLLGGVNAFQDSCITRVSISNVSQVIEVDSSEELLIHPEYIHSSSHQGKKDTKWLLDWTCPLSSLASGLHTLTRIRPDAAAAYVVSATKDPLSEVAVISLPTGSALVLQPHYLVGIVRPINQPMVITRHWRLGSLHAWLTLQFRYIVFHGPVELIIKGCRGVGIERAGTGRFVNQAATIGFTANVSYGTHRCDTFASYLMGKQELFNDSFVGGDGAFVYEEMPHFGKKAGLTGRGLEGLTDAVLKVFGI